MQLRNIVLVALILATALVACQRGDEAEEAPAGDIFDLPVDHTYLEDGLQDEVNVLIDQWGIPHVYARNDHDAWYVQGYLVSRDRFFQMDMARRLGSGRLGEILGEVPLLGSLVASIVAKEIDLYYRTIFMGRDGRPIVDAILEQIDEPTMAALQAYADGVNAYLSDMVTRRYGVTEPPIYEGIVNPDAAKLDPWTVRDTLVLLVVSMWSASNSVDQELALGEALAGLGMDRFIDFYRVAPDDPTTVLPDGMSDIAPSSLDEKLIASDHLVDAIEAIRAAREAGRAAGNSLFGQGQHSNNWVVDGAHSATGYPLLANDPHLSMLNPPYFWLCHIDSKTLGDGTLSFAGLSFPGAPGVQIGHNDAIGWAGTSACYDTYDAYIETLNPDDPDAVLYEGKSVKLRRPAVNNELFEIGLDDSHQAKHYPIQIVPHHGPIVPGSCRKGACVSLRWTGMEPGDEIKSFLDILTAQDLEEGLAAFAQYKRGPYNWIVADRSGRIGYIAAAELPIRKNWRDTPPFLPLPGEGGSEWSGTVADTKIARYLDPANGWIATANNDIYGTLLDNDPLNDADYYYGMIDIGYRAGRIASLLSGNDKKIDPNAFNLEDMRRIQADNVSMAGERLLPHLFAAAKSRPDLITFSMKGALDFLEAWDFTTPASVADFYRPAVPADQEKLMSIGAMLFHVWFGYAAQRTYGDDFHDARLDMPGDETESGPQFETRALLFLLEHGDQSRYGEAWWDDSETVPVEKKEEILLGALQDAIDYLSEEIGPDMTQWQWGKLHTAQFGLTFDGFTIPDLIAPIVGPAAADGGNFTVNVANSYSLNDDYEASHAPAARMVMNIDGDRFESWAVLPGGQSERFDSEHYADLFGHYLAGELVPVYFTVDEIVPVTVEHIKFVPRGND